MRRRRLGVLFVSAHCRTQSLARCAAMRCDAMQCDNDFFYMGHRLLSWQAVQRWSVLHEVQSGRKVVSWWLEGTVSYWSVA